MIESSIISQSLRAHACPACIYVMCRLSGSSTRFGHCMQVPLDLSKRLGEMGTSLQICHRHVYHTHGSLRDCRSERGKRLLLSAAEAQVWCRYALCGESLPASSECVRQDNLQLTAQTVKPGCAADVAQWPPKVMDNFAQNCHVIRPSKPFRMKVDPCLRTLPFLMTDRRSLPRHSFKHYW